MKTNLKRGLEKVFSVVMIAVMVMTLIPVNAFGEEDPHAVYIQTSPKEGGRVEVSTDNGFAYAGENVTVEVFANSNYYFLNCFVSKQGGETPEPIQADFIAGSADAAAALSFTMPDADVVVEANFAVKPTLQIPQEVSNFYNVSGAPTGLVDPDKTFTLTIDPKEVQGIRYKVTGVRVQKKDDSGVYRDLSNTAPGQWTLTMPYYDAVLVVDGTYSGAYDLTVNSNEYGEVTADPTSPKYNELVTLTAQPTEGSVLKSIVVKDSFNNTLLETSSSSATFTMPQADVTVEAVFIHQYNVKIDEKIELGEVTASLTKAEAGKKVDLTVTPEEDAVFKEGSLKVTDSAGQEIPVTNNSFTMPKSDVTVTAEFNKLFNVTIGTVTGEGCSVTADVEKALNGTKITLTPNAAEGYELARLSAAGGTETITIAEDNTFTMPAADVTVTAVFEKLYKVTINQNIQNGSISVDKSSAIKGTPIKVTVTPAEKYKLKEVTFLNATGQTVSITLDSRNIFEMPEYDVEITAVFEREWGITLEQPENGTVSTNLDKAPEGVLITIAAKPDEGYAVVGASATDGDNSLPVSEKTDGTSQDSNVKYYTFTMPASDDVVVTAEMDRVFKVILSPPANGVLTASSNGAVRGATVEIEAIPYANFRLKSVEAYVGENKYPMEGSGTKYTLTMPGSDVTVSATFEQVYGITIADAENGTVEISNKDTLFEEEGKVSALEGATVTLKPIPADGYGLKTLKVTDPSGNEIELKDNSFVMPKSAVTVTATFEKTYRVNMAEMSKGSVLPSATSALAGEKITLTPQADENAVLKSISVINSKGYQVLLYEDYAFTMPAMDVTVKAEFADTYKVTIGDHTGGTVTTDVARAAEGSTVTVEVAADKDYVFDSVTVMGSDGKAVSLQTGNKFTMPPCNVTVTAKFTATEHVHNWGEPYYQWSSDDTKVTATRVCKDNALHVETETVNAIITTIRPASTSTQGEDLYTATFTNPAFAKQTKTKIVSSVVTYYCAEGNGVVKNKGNTDGWNLRFTCSTHDSECVSHFKRVLMNGVVVDPLNYTVSSGSLILKFKPEYINTLAAGNHTVTVEFDDGKGTATLTITDPNSSNNNSSNNSSSTNRSGSPRTGDPSKPVLAGIAMAGSLTVAAVLFLRLRSKRKDV